MRTLLFVIASTLTVFISSSCKDQNIIDTAGESEPIAAVYDAVLYKNDLSGLVDKNASKEDSASIVERYVNSWVDKQLMLHRAEKVTEFDKQSIERRVVELRQQLMIYEFQNYFLKSNMNIDITKEDIRKYYDEHLQDFELKKNIIKGYFIKIAKASPDVEKVKKTMKSDKPEDFESLRTLATAYAEKFYLNDSIWFNFDQIIAGTPFENIANQTQFLKYKTFETEEDEKYYYFLRVKEYKISKDEHAPLDFVSNQIRNILISKEKQRLIAELEQELYENAKDRNEIIIYED